MAKRTKLVGQQRVVKAKLTTIIGRKAFGVGFESARKGEGWPADYNSMEPRDQWSFERGRQLAIIAPTIILKNGRSVTQGAVKAFAEALDSGSIR